MKPQFTPGPWLVRFDEDRFDSKLSVLEVIDGSEASLNHPQGELVLARVNVSAFAPHMDEPLTNAHLIASAPDLLSALERLTHPMADDDDLDYAREVIRKAKRGGQP
jgi:hypothetical protein